MMLLLLLSSPLRERSCCGLGFAFFFRFFFEKKSE